MLVVFRDADGNVVPKPGTNVRVDVTIEPVKQRTMFKYIKQNSEVTAAAGVQGMLLIERPFVLQGAYKFSQSYVPALSKDSCDARQVAELFERDNGTTDIFCVEEISAQESLPFSKLPVYGTWRIKLASGWPKGVPRPVSVDVKVNLVANADAKCASSVVGASVISELLERQQRVSISQRADMAGDNICGGIVFRRDALLPSGTDPTSSPASDIALILVATLLVAIAAGMHYRSRRTRNAPTAAAGTAVAVSQ
jgi:hypothetical protein